MDPEDSELPALDEEGFDDGFTPPTPTETPGTTEEAPPEPQPEYVQITKTQWDELMAAAAEVPVIKAAHEKGLGTAFGKIGGIERKLNSADVEIEQADIDAMRGDGFESHARALEKIRDLKVVRLGGNLTDEDKADIRTSLKREMQIEEVAEEHPDWNEVARTPEFAAWKATQSAADQAKLDNDWSPRFIVKKLTEFKAHRGAAAAPPPPPEDSTRRSRIQAAVTPRGNGGNPAANTEDEFDEGFRQR